MPIETAKVADSDEKLLIQTANIGNVNEDGNIKRWDVMLLRHISKNQAFEKKINRQCSVTTCIIVLFRYINYQIGKKIIFRNENHL